LVRPEQVKLLPITLFRCAGVCTHSTFAWLLWDISIFWLGSQKLASKKQEQVLQSLVILRVAQESISVDFTKLATAALNDDGSLRGIYFWVLADVAVDFRNDEPVANETLDRTPRTPIALVQQLPQDSYDSFTMSISNMLTKFSILST